jgi:multiple sugar transport system substrate-binding protein
VADKAGAAGGGWHDVSQQNHLVDGRWRAVPWGMTGNESAYRQHSLKDAADTDAFPATWEEFTRLGGEVKQPMASRS